MTSNNQKSQFIRSTSRISSTVANSNRAKGSPISNVCLSVPNVPPVPVDSSQEVASEIPSQPGKAYLSAIHIPDDLIISQDSPTLLHLVKIATQELKLRIKATKDKNLDLKKK
jgi:hypothetical protein